VRRAVQQHARRHCRNQVSHRQEGRRHRQVQVQRRPLLPGCVPGQLPGRQNPVQRGLRGRFQARRDRLGHHCFH